MIERGHRLPDVLDYTFAQVRGFMDAAGRADAQREARLLSLIQLGTRGDAKAIDKALDTLDDHAHLRSHR